MINKLSKEIHDNNVEKGFYDEEKNIGEMLALVHSEVSEALEADRKDIYTTGDVYDINDIEDDEEFQKQFREGIKDSFEDEMADVVIRIMDLSYFKGVDLEEHIKAKMRFNSLRAHKHGKKY
ncbi:MAG: nucleoside triphosphate pyrophosphohydrolase, MazG [uncultured marine phage]|uniref:Nucleoside triphosphate pyrophosphohydrolase, MazG n=1 Tax=uncultured marine phage TaxID=707152 RepID=A0A8D9CDI4_9VIRU|nr:MAG: nucleoside triphosphate pyrophosphohydrolase, MazG [uncultured marine phage]